MKTRNGFVSNSSSSSFVVERYDRRAKKMTKLLSPKIDRLLKKNRFRLEIAYYPDQVGYPTHQSIDPKDRKLANWVRFTSCNQEDEIVLLLKNRISFSADLHYGHYSMQYDGKTDMLIIAQNFGKQIQMWGTDKMNFVSALEKEPVHRTTGEKYLKLHKYLT